MDASRLFSAAASIIDSQRPAAAAAAVPVQAVTAIAPRHTAHLDMRSVKGDALPLSLLLAEELEKNYTVDSRNCSALVTVLTCPMSFSLSLHYQYQQHQTFLTY